MEQKGSIRLSHIYTKGLINILHKIRIKFKNKKDKKRLDSIIESAMSIQNQSKYLFK